MNRFLSALAALTLVFSLSTGDALAKKGGDTITFDKIGSEKVDAVFTSAQGLNDKLVGAKTKLEGIKAAIATKDPAKLATAKTDLAALTADLAGIPDEIKGLVDAAKAVKPGDLGLKGMQLIKGGKALAGNVGKLPKVAKNAQDLIKEVSDTAAGL